MKIGDKVRFLSEIGGGKVSGFQGKDTVLVEDEDGFDIPMPISQVVVIDTDDYNIAKVNTRTPIRSAMGKQQSEEEEEEVDIADLPRTFKPRPMEKRGGDRLNIYLAYLPREAKDENDQHYEAYLINDTNYYLQALYLTAENASWQCRFMATLEPNSRQRVDEFLRSQLPEREHLCIQLLAYKQDKPFALKPVVSVELRLDAVKFYKPHTFRHCTFFPDPVLLYDLVRDDQPRTTKC